VGGVWCLGFEDDSVGLMEFLICGMRQKACVTLGSVIVCNAQNDI
jgi:hypothetical protein